ncbi:concanavalin A-like lectin/glucanase domain-containing protein [Alternaria rosae]|uniref:concanavalin A-like lectin/glucanase domain-containing protein n=1 Tax=Alternaria rosae TaxID=1187941 RepID=UPI001E8E5198|nr:concanavalin A-like lectin/glucanase domain-containing protein [Alternaria rosae]KAH6858893.1 concanavalin A-like lectin/glucanase domain-containing protein [Alternaria rosae]
MHLLNVSLLPLSLILFSTTQTLAQTSTDCDPTKKSCPADTALSSSVYTHDFTTGADDENWKVTAGDVKYTSKGAEFTINKAGDAPTIQSNWYIFFGSVSFVMKAAPGKGVVSSAILESDDLDEVDWEWLGGQAGNVQTNYFGKGNTTTHDREVDAPISDTQGTSHNYTIAWTSSSTTWLVDGDVKRTLRYSDANGGSNYPQTPMNVRIGIWAGGDPNNAEGTIEWAGGETDYSAAPFTMVVEKVEVRNENPGGSYQYGDMTGSFESIVVDGGDGKVKKSGSEDGEKSASSTTSSGLKTEASASASATVNVNVDGGVGGEHAMETGSSTGAMSTASATPTGSATGSAAVAEQTGESGAVLGKSLGGGLLVLSAMAMLLI